MKLLTEVMDLNELTRIRILFESNGIPVFIGNEDAARNMGLILVARKYGVYVLYDEQFHDAQRLLEDESYVVENQIDMDEHRRNMELLKPDADSQLFKGVMVIGAVVMVLFLAFVWLMTAINT